MNRRDAVVSTGRKLVLVLRHLYGLWGLLAFVVALVVATYGDPSAVDNALKLAVTPLAVIQGLVIFSLHSPLDQSTGVERAALRWVQNSALTGTAAIGLILLHVALLPEGHWDYLRTYAAGFTALALVMPTRISQIRTLRDELKKDPERFELKLSVIGRMAAALVPYLLGVLIVLIVVWVS